MASWSGIARPCANDQMLGGPSGQSYLGCRFPADPAYASTITREAAKVGERLAREGAIGRFAIDFVTIRKGDGGWEPYAMELNLRKGGTTHLFLTLQFLKDGTYDAERATFSAPNGQEKCFVASDHVEVRSTGASPPTICSTSSSGTASISTSRARPGWSST
jgi:hypothetical protein